MTKIRAYAALLRLPNVFTAVADPLAGWLLTGGAWSAQLLPVLGTSACLYSSGIVFNDCFGYAADCRERPERPLPSGAVARGVAWTLAVALMLAGLALAWLAGTATLQKAAILAALILVYNGVRKLPGIMGACRAFNLLLGMTDFTVLWPPMALGVYVTVLSVVAQRDTANPAARRWVKRLLLGIIALDAAFVVAVTGNWADAAAVLALLLPAWLLARFLEMT